MSAKKVKITIEVPMESLDGYADAYLAKCWNLAQANPAPPDDAEASRLVEVLGFEIIRRWLSERSPVLYERTATAHYHHVLMDHGKWIDGVWTPNHLVPIELKAVSP